MPNQMKLLVLSKYNYLLDNLMRGIICLLILLTIAGLRKTTLNFQLRIWHRFQMMLNQQLVQAQILLDQLQMNFHILSHWFL